MQQKLRSILDGIGHIMGPALPPCPSCKSPGVNPTEEAVLLTMAQFGVPQSLRQFVPAGGIGWCAKCRLVYLYVPRKE